MAVIHACEAITAGQVRSWEGLLFDHTANALTWLSWAFLMHCWWFYTLCFGQQNQLPFRKSWSLTWRPHSEFTIGQCYKNIFLLCVGYLASNTGTKLEKHWIHFYSWEFVLTKYQQFFSLLIKVSLCLIASLPPHYFNVWLLEKAIPKQQKHK